VEGFWAFVVNCDLINHKKFFYVLLTAHLRIILENNQPDAQFFPYMFISILYMFRATTCSSSGESIVSIRYLAYVTLCGDCLVCRYGWKLWFGRSGASNILHNLELFIHMFKGCLLKSTLHHTGTWSAAAWPPRRPCYRPAVFFRYSLLTSLPLMVTRIRTYLLWNLGHVL